MAVAATKDSAGEAAHGIPRAVAATLAPKIAVYFDELQRWNKAIRLIGQSDCQALLQHLGDSLSVYPLLAALASEAEPMTIGDVGSGNGMPGIPLALCIPQSNFRLIESNQKRCAFLQNAIALIGLQNCTVVCARIEELARQQQEQAAYQVLLARALTDWSRKLAAAFAGCLAADGKAIVYARPQSEKSASIAEYLQSVFPRTEQVARPLNDPATAGGGGSFIVSSLSE